MNRLETAAVNGIRMHYGRAGEGPPLVLLHGWPQTSYCWHQVVEPLARTHTVITPDLRGYGHTDKPRHGYDKPDEVERLAVLDIIPTREMWRRADATTASAYWHWFFHLQPDLPELLAGNDVAGYLGYFFERWTYRRSGLTTAAVDEYVRAFSAPGALRAGFDDYRASFPDDAEHDDADAAAGRKLTMPVLALWGEAGLLGSVPALDIWRDYATSVTGGAIAECGHFLAEERPQALIDQLTPFLTDG